MMRCEWCNEIIEGVGVEGEEGTYCNEDCLQECEPDYDWALAGAPGVWA